MFTDYVQINYVEIGDGSLEVNNVQINTESKTQ